MILTLGSLQRRLIYKETNQGLISNAALVDDEFLQIPVDMDHRYLFEATIFFRLLGPASGYRFGLSAPGDNAGTQLQMQAEVTNGVTNLLDKVKVDLNAPMSISGSMADIGAHCLKLKGLMTVATGYTGLFKFQFGQLVADVNAIRVLQGSVLEIEDYA